MIPTNSVATDQNRPTREQWQTRLQQLACEAGEQNYPSLELGFICLYRASKLPDLIRRGLANAAMLQLSVVEDADRYHRRTLKDKD